MCCATISSIFPSISPDAARFAAPLILLDIEPSGTYFLSLFRDAGLEPHIGLRAKSLEMVRGFVGHGLGYGLLATKPANNMTYDGRALVARPLTGAVKNSSLVLVALRGRPDESDGAGIRRTQPLFFRGRPCTLT